MENQQLEKSKLFDLTSVVTSLKQGELKIQEVRKYISDIKSELDTIEIVDENDSENMQKVHELKQKLVKQRIPLEGERKLINSNYITPLKNHVDRTYKDVTDEIEEVEGHSQIIRLKQMKELAETKKELARQVKEQEIDDKVNQLCDLSFTFNGVDRYTNGKGQSFDRMIVQMMNDSDWLTFLGVAQQSHEVIEKEKQAEEERQQKIQGRKNEFAKLGLQENNGIVAVLNLETNKLEAFQIDFEDDYKFSLELQKMIDLLGANASYSENFKKFQEAQAEKARQQSEEEAKIKLEKEQLNKEKLQLHSKSLLEKGFITLYGTTIYDAKFKFENKFGVVEVKSTDIIEGDAEKVIANAIEMANGYSKELLQEQEAQEKQRIAAQERLAREAKQSEEARQKDEEKQKQEQLEKEAKKRREATPSLKLIDKSIASIQQELELENINDVVLPYFTNLQSKIKNAISEFNDEVKHFR